MINSNPTENLASFSLFNQGTISTAAADAANAASNPELSSYGVVGGGFDPSGVVGLGRLAAINAINELGLLYLLTYTAGTPGNNDTVASATVVDGVVQIVVYQHTGPVVHPFLTAAYTMGISRQYEIYFAPGQTVPASNSLIRIVGSNLDAYNQLYLVKDPLPTFAGYWNPGNFETAMELIPLEKSLSGNGYAGTFYDPVSGSQIPLTFEGWIVDENIVANTADMLYRSSDPNTMETVVDFYLNTYNYPTVPQVGKLINIIGTGGGMNGTYDRQYIVMGVYTNEYAPLSPSFPATRVRIKPLESSWMINWPMNSVATNVLWTYAPNDYSWSFNGDWMNRNTQDLDDWTMIGDGPNSQLILKLQAGSMNSDAWPMYYKLLNNSVTPENNGYAGHTIQLTNVQSMYESPNRVADGSFTVASSYIETYDNGMSNDNKRVWVRISVPQNVANDWATVYEYGAQITGLVVLQP